MNALEGWRKAALLYHRRRWAMPSRTAKQHRAMQAAAHGSSTLGIPPKVGKDFVQADKKAGKQFSLKRERRGKK